MKSAHKLSDGPFESLAVFGESRLRGVCEALGLDEQDNREARGLFRLVGDSWADCPVGGRPPWSNDITDDGTPFEFSVGFEAEKPELRLLFESQLAGASSLRSSFQAGIVLQNLLRLKGLADTLRFEQIAPLFVPQAGATGARFSLWHAAVLRSGAAPLFKAYLNPQVGGAEHAATLAAEAFTRLNLGSCWSFVSKRLSPELGIPYLSLDLEATNLARAKVYLSATNADQVEALLVGCANIQLGEARQWLRTLTGKEGEYLKRPILVCFSFTDGGQAANATVHVPVRSYVSSDEEALERATPLLQEPHARKLAAAVTSMANGPLYDSHGVLSYVSLRPVDGRVRVTTYLAPGAYSAPLPHYSSGTHPKG